MREREETHLTDFRKFLEVKKFTLPAGYDDENRLVLRFLQGLKWDYQKTYDEILEHAEWRSKINMDPTQYLEDLEKGVLYGMRRDKMMHPVIIINVRRLIDTKMELESLLGMADFFLNYVIENAMVPGSIEAWTCIFDLKGVGVTQIPKDKIQGLVRNMTKNYRGRLFRFYSTDVTFVVR